MGRQWNIRPPNTEEKTCLMCGRTFHTLYPQQIYCSEDCAKKAKLKAVKRYKDKKKGTKPVLARKCVFCGKNFETKDIRKKYCSPYCAKEANKKQGRDRDARLGRPSNTRPYEILKDDESIIMPSVVLMRDIPLTEDPVYQFAAELHIEDNYAETLDYIEKTLERGETIYAKNAELISAPSPSRLILHKLEHAIDNVNPRKVQEMKVVERARGRTEREYLPVKTNKEERDTYQTSPYIPTGYEPPETETRNTTLIIEWNEKNMGKDEILKLSREIAAFLSEDEDKVKEVRMIVKKNYTNHEDDQKEK